MMFFAPVSTLLLLLLLVRANTHLIIVVCRKSSDLQCNSMSMFALSSGIAAVYHATHLLSACTLPPGLCARCTVLYVPVCCSTSEKLPRARQTQDQMGSQRWQLSRWSRFPCSHPIAMSISKARMQYDGLGLDSESAQRIEYVTRV